MYATKTWGFDPQGWPVVTFSIVPELTGEHWQVVQTPEWPDQRGAYLMEQAVIDRLGHHGIRCSGEYFPQPLKSNRITITLWTEAIFAAHKAYSAKDDEI